MAKPQGFLLPELGMRRRGSLGWVAAAMVCWAARLEGQILAGPSCAWMQMGKQLTGS